MKLIQTVLRWLIKLFTSTNNNSPHISASGSIYAGGDILVGSAKNEFHTVTNIQNYEGTMISQKSRNGMKTRKEYDPITETERVISVTLDD